MFRTRDLFVTCAALLCAATLVFARDHRPAPSPRPAPPSRRPAPPAPTDRVSLLVQELFTGSAHERSKAADELGFIGGERAVPALSRAALSDPETQVREDSLEALGRIGSPSGVDACVRALQSEPDGDTRERAAQSLGYIGDRRAIPALQWAHSHDRDSHVRDQAKTALQRILARPAPAPLPPTPGRGGPGYRGDRD